VGLLATTGYSGLSGAFTISAYHDTGLSAAWLQDADFNYTGDLCPYRNSISYTGYVVVPLPTPATSTSYDGDAVNAGAYTIDTSTVFSLPAGIKGVFAMISCKWASTGDNIYLRAGETGAHGNAVIVTPFAADVRAYASGLIPCDANGDFVITIAGANTTYVVIQVYGYLI
jgi:hypothetical protein